MTLDEFREQTKDLPGNTLLVVDTSNEYDLSAGIEPASFELGLFQFVHDRYYGYQEQAGVFTSDIRKPFYDEELKRYDDPVYAILITA